MSFNSNITPGRPPLLWSEVNDAFVKINENFDSLIAAGLGGGLVPVDFNTLDTDVSPTTDNVRSLGSITNRWRTVYTGEHTLSNPTNGVFLGLAQIKGVDLTVNLPEGSTIGGDPLTGVGTSLIIDPDKTFFKEIQVDNNFSVVATSFGDTVNLLSGSGINLTVNSSADSIEIDNTGILSVAPGVGISVATVSGTATVNNTGVRSLQNTTTLPLGRSTGTGINISGTTGDNLRITNTGVISVTAGLGITVSVDVATGEFQVTNSAPAQPAFQQIEVNGDSVNRLIADGTAGVFRIVSGQGIALARTVGTDTMTITVNPEFDLTGSIFSDGSTKLVDAVEGKIVGDIETSRLRTSESKIALGVGAAATAQGSDAVAIGYYAGETSQGGSAVAIGGIAGNTSQGNFAIAVGSLAGNASQGTQAIAIGREAGKTSQGANAVAIGNKAGETSQTAGSIVINASGVALNGSAAGFYVDPIRNVTGANGVVQYDATTKEVSYSTALGTVSGTLSGTFTGNIFTNLIDSADSSAITVTPATIFSSDITVQNDITAVRLFTSLIDSPDSSTITVTPATIFSSDVIVENDLNVTQRFLLRGSRVINLTELKSVVAASTDFANFKTRIAALV